MKKKKLKSLKNLKDEAWDLQSKHIRQEGADDDGFTHCYTCGIRKHWKELQAGHYIHNRLDFERNNLRKQCVRCNKWLRGNLGVYGERLIKEIGLETVEKMRLYSYQKGNNYTRLEVNEIIKTYK